METLLLDLTTLALALGIAVLCAVGLAALPWRAAELDQALAAVRALPRLLASAAGLPAGLPPRRRARRPSLSRSAALH